MTVYTFGFEGPNRVGKGTQIAFLSDYLEENGIPFIVVRGDGSRLAAGGHRGDPASTWWMEMNAKLKTTAGLHNWNKASVRLCQEYLAFKEISFPQWLKKHGFKAGVILVDRTILSRHMITREEGNISWEDLYPQTASFKRLPITGERVCPDVVINLRAPKPVLISRLKVSDPKYDFRRLLIIEKSDWYREVLSLLPKHILEKIVTIDSTEDPKVVFERVKEKFKASFPLLFKKKKK